MRRDTAYPQRDDSKAGRKNWMSRFSTATGRIITPTPHRRKIIRQAQIVLNETQCIKEVVADETDSMNGNLRIGILPTIRSLPRARLYPSFPENLPARKPVH